MYGIVDVISMFDSLCIILSVIDSSTEHSQPAYSDSAVVTFKTTEVSNCAGVYRLEHNYIFRYIKISQLPVSALMAIFRLDTKLDEKAIYNMVHYIHKCGVRGDEISSPLTPHLCM